MSQGATATARVAIDVNSLAMANAAGELVLTPGAYTLILSTGTVGAPEIEVPLTVGGERKVLEVLPQGI